MGGSGKQKAGSRKRKAESGKREAESGKREAESGKRKAVPLGGSGFFGWGGKKGYFVLCKNLIISFYRKDAKGAKVAAMDVDVDVNQQYTGIERRKERHLQQ